MKRAVIYCRISSDQRGEGLGVARQEAEARELCKRHGWTVVNVYSDNDISAWSARKVRPAYRDMLAAIKRDEVDVVVAWHPDRLHRQTRELVSFIDLVEAHHVAVETVTAGTLDLSTPTGRMQARIVGTVAEFESEHKSERIRSKLKENAAKGRHHGGSRPYGWNNDRVTLDPTEAAVVRDAARRALAGASMRSIARALNEAGHATATGKPWRDVNVRDMLMRGRNAGLRMHHGETVGKGQWEPILDEATHLQLKAILTAPGRRTTPGRDGKVHLLTTIASCAVCGGPAEVALGNYAGGERRRVYRCRPGHVIRQQAELDAFVGALVIERLSRPDARELLRHPEQTDTTTDALAEAERLRHRLDEAAEAYAAGVLTLAQLETVTRSLRPKIGGLEAVAADAGRVRVLAPMLERDPAEAWGQLLPEQRRAVVALLMRIVLHPSKGRKNSWETVDIEWRA